MPPRTSSRSRHAAGPLAQDLATNPLERVNGEIKRHTNVVGIFLNDASVLRLVTAVIVETHDEWAVAERRYLPEESMAKLNAEPAIASITEELPPHRHRLSNTVDVEPLTPASNYTTPRGVIAAEGRIEVKVVH